MKKKRLEIRVIREGERPACAENGRQCRGCFGWRNMLHAARTSALWRRYPLHCPATGLTVEVCWGGGGQRSGSGHSATGS